MRYQRKSSYLTNYHTIYGQEVPINFHCACGGLNVRSSQKGKTITNSFKEYRATSYVETMSWKQLTICFSVVATSSMYRIYKTMVKKLGSQIGWEGPSLLFHLLELESRFDKKKQSGFFTACQCPYLYETYGRRGVTKYTRNPHWT